MTIDILILLASLGLILLAAFLFTNAIELLGHRLSIHQGAIGSVLAAVGTAMPETIIPIIAILLQAFGGGKHAAAKGVAIGAIAGAPFMLGTLALFVTGLAVIIYSLMGRRSHKMVIEEKSLNRDLTYFVIVYAVAVLTTFVTRDNFCAAYYPIRIGVVAFLVLAYIFYLKRTFAADAPMAENVDELLLARGLQMRARMGLVIAQIAAALGLMVYGSDLFVDRVEMLAPKLGISVAVLSLIITPIATELPEKLNSVIWVGKRKDILAIGNMTGAMVFQSSFPVIFGILFTDWNLLADGGVTMASAILAFTSALVILAWVKWRRSLNPYILLFGGVLYGLFLIFLWRGR